MQEKSKCLPEGNEDINVFLFTRRVAVREQGVLTGRKYENEWKT